MSAAPPELDADLTEGLKALRLKTIREIAPEVLATAKTQRWAPAELLRTLVSAECEARAVSNMRTRMKQAAFPVSKTLDEFEVAQSSIPEATFSYLQGLEWLAAPENLCLIGPAGTGKSHMLVGLGIAAVEAGKRVRYFTAPDLIENLYRGLADNTVSKQINSLLRADLVIVDELGFAPLDPMGSSPYSLHLGCLRAASARDSKPPAL